VGEFKASMGLALYVLGYGIGPLIFAPLSEGNYPSFLFLGEVRTLNVVIVPQLGRNIPYIVTLALLTILALPAALVDNVGASSSFASYSVSSVVHVY
jgi:DHA1 family multidrug resistance protein-like MFS transporter